MLPLISLSPERFSKQHSQAFAGLKSIIEYSTNDPKKVTPKSSLTLSRFQDLSTALEKNQGTFELVHGLKSFAQNLEQETVSVRKALLYLKRLPLPEFSEELCRYSDQIYPTLEKQALPLCRYKTVDWAPESQESDSLKIVLVEISQDKVFWQYNQILDYITRLIGEVSSKKCMLEKSVHEIDRLTNQITAKSKKIEVITMKALGQKAIHLFQDHHGLLRDLGEAIRKIETTYSVHFHPYVILHVFISAIQYRQQQLASFLLDENYNWIEKMASDIEITVQTAISLAHQIMQQHDKLMGWRRKLLELYLDKKKQICRVKSDKNYSLDKSRLLEQKKTLTHKSFSKLQDLTSETAQTAQQFLSRVRSLFHQIDEKISSANNIDHRERDLLTQLITSSFNVPASKAASTSEQSIVPKKNAQDHLEFNSRASASHIHSFELKHQSELERLLYLIQVLDSQGKVLVMVNEIFSSWIQPLGHCSDGKS